MRTLVAFRLLPLLAVTVAGIGLALSASAATTKAAPYCKTGQKSTTAHPCVKPPKCKTGQKSTKTHPCVKPTTTSSGTAKPASGSTTGSGSSAASSTTTTTGSSSASSGATGATAATGSGGALQADGCDPGQVIPQGAFAGDGDEDNTGMPDDGDGCL